MAVFNYVAANATKIQPSLTGYTREGGWNGRTWDAEYPTIDGQSVNSYFSYAYGEFVFQLNSVDIFKESVNSSKFDYANITMLGAVDGTQLILLSVIKNSKMTYAIYDLNGNKVKDFTDLHAADKWTDVYSNADGDVILEYKSGNTTYYSQINSGYNGLPVATTDATAASVADKPILIDLASLASDPASEPVTVESVTIGSIDTSDDSTGSVIVVKDAMGNLVVVYTGVLAQGETATVPITFSASDGIAQDTDGLLTVTFTGTGADTVSLTLAQAELLISAGYDTFAEIGGSIAGFALVAKEAVLTSFNTAKLDALVDLGVTTFDATDDKLSLSVAEVQAIRNAGIHFAEADAVTMTGKGAAIAALSAEEISGLAGDFVDVVDATNNEISLSYAQVQAFIDSGLQLGAKDVVTLSDSATNLFSLQTDALDALVAFDVKTIDLTDATATSYASTFQLLDQAGLSFVKSDNIVMSTNVPQIEEFSNKELSAFAKMGVDYLDFYTYDGARLVTKAFIHRIEAAGLKLLDPDQLVYPTTKNDSFNGTYSDDNINALAGNDTVDGRDGNDTIAGGSGKDKLMGGSGNDVINGGLDDDRLSGGTGNDTFVFQRYSGRDVITDFAAASESEQDLIDVSRFTGLDVENFKDFDDLKLKTVGDDVVIIFNKDWQVKLENVSINDLDANDFIF